MKKIKVLWTHNFPSVPGGGGNWMYNQHSFFEKDADLYFMSNLKDPIQFLRHTLRIYKLSKEYDIVHAQYGSAVGFITSLMPCKRVLSLKGSDWYTSPGKSLFHKLRVFLGNWLTRLSISRYDFIIVMSDKMKQEVLAKFPNKKVQVVVDPIDLKRFVSGNPNDVSMNREHKILFAATDMGNPIKRLWLAEESVEMLREELPNIKLVKMSGIAHGDVPNFMDNMDVLLITSVYEGWPNVVKEMLALNKPFVGTDISDLKSIAKRTESCYVCNPDPKEISMALKKALSSPKENLRKHVENFEMTKTLDKIRTIYSNVL